jgi:hypothetical protein
MERLRNFLSGEFVEVEIDFSKCQWHTAAGVPAENGWYYIETNKIKGVEALYRFAMIQAHATGAYSYKKIAEHFGVHFTTEGKVV